MGARNRLSDRYCKKELEIGLHCDGGGLNLQVSKVSKRVTKAWVYRFMLAGRPRKMGLGAYPDISLASARDLAEGARKLLLQGIDPIAQRDDRRAALVVESAKAMTFKECAIGYIKAHQHEWKSAKHGKQWPSTLEQYVFPVIGPLPVAAIDTAQVVRVLEPIWRDKGETARRVRSRIEMVLDRAAALDLRSGDNPARLTGKLKHLLGAQVRIVKHHKALHYRDMPRFMAKLREREYVSAKALEFTILTACRTGDSLGAQWSEIDMKEKVWTIPAARLKGKLGKRKNGHVVPLSDRALEILKKIPREGDFVFPGAREGLGLNDAALSDTLKEMDVGVTVHGFRSTFRDWGGDTTEYPNEMLELALAHTISDETERAYRRGDMREKRRRMMEEWSRYCASAPRGDAKVVTLRGKPS
jgi:integrase